MRSGDTLSGIASRQRKHGTCGSGTTCVVRAEIGQVTVGAGSSAQRLANNSDSIAYRVRRGDSLLVSPDVTGVNIKDGVRWNHDTADNLTGDRKHVVCEGQ